MRKFCFTVLVYALGFGVTAAMGESGESPSGEKHWKKSPLAQEIVRALKSRSDINSTEALAVLYQHPEWAEDASILIALKTLTLERPDPMMRDMVDIVYSQYRGGDITTEQAEGLAGFLSATDSTNIKCAAGMLQTDIAIIKSAEEWHADARGRWQAAAGRISNLAEAEQYYKETGNEKGIECIRAQASHGLTRGYVSGNPGQTAMLQLMARGATHVELLALILQIQKDCGFDLDDDAAHASCKSGRWLRPWNILPGPGDLNFNLRHLLTKLRTVAQYSQD